MPSDDGSVGILRSLREIAELCRCVGEQGADESSVGKLDTGRMTIVIGRVEQHRRFAPRLPLIERRGRQRRNAIPSHCLRGRVFRGDYSVPIVPSTAYPWSAACDIAWQIMPSTGIGPEDEDRRIMMILTVPRAFGPDLSGSDDPTGPGRGFIPWGAAILTAHRGRSFHHPLERTAVEGCTGVSDRADRSRDAEVSASHVAPSPGRPAQAGGPLPGADRA